MKSYKINYPLIFVVTLIVSGFVSMASDSNSPKSPALHRIGAKGFRNGCTRALIHERKLEYVDDSITNYCEKMYWTVLKELDDSTGLTKEENN